ncbi:hypothetical protein IWX46DRAFT_137151 [Phyllosticta citricarpa]|uniref:Uncharacterized protein n=1 Tax=Phyllosticta citricarpa TaxID=55181 RepID=A0ABR1MRN0_9PEZI
MKKATGIRYVLMGWACRRRDGRCVGWTAGLAWTPAVRSSLSGRGRASLANPWSALWPSVCMALPHHTRTLAHHSQYPSIALSLSRLILLLVFFFFSFFFFFLFFVFNSHLLAFVHHPSILHHITLHRICCTSRVPPCWPASALLHLLHCATLAWPTTTSSSSSSQLS